MQSRWFELKEKAISLRRKGFSLKDVETKLGIPRSTLSGWFKNVELSEEQKQKLDLRWRQNLIKARKEAVLWHNKGKEGRLKTAEMLADLVLEKINKADSSILELSLAILYLGEGSKKTPVTSLGNSDPLILKFFLFAIDKLYGISNDQVACSLHLRFDQDDELMKKYWSKELNVPLTNFKTASKDKRTAGKPTYNDYKGVCVIKCDNVATQRKLVYLSRKYCQKVLN